MRYEFIRAEIINDTFIFVQPTIIVSSKSSYEQFNITAINILILFDLFSFDSVITVNEALYTLKMLG